jgi:hypothetical protein
VAGDRKHSALADSPIPGPDLGPDLAENRGPAPIPGLPGIWAWSGRDSGPDSAGPGPGPRSTLSTLGGALGVVLAPHIPFTQMSELDEAAVFEISDDNSKELEDSDISESVSTR